MEKISKFEEELEAFKASLKPKEFGCPEGVQEVPIYKLEANYIKDKRHNQGMFFSKFEDMNVFKLTCFLERKGGGNDIEYIETSGGKYIVMEGADDILFTLNIPFCANLDYFRGERNWKELVDTTVTFGPDDTVHTYDLKEVIGYNIQRCLDCQDLWEAWLDWHDNPKE